MVNSTFSKKNFLVDQCMFQIKQSKNGYNFRKLGALKIKVFKNVKNKKHAPKCNETKIDIEN